MERKQAKGQVRKQEKQIKRICVFCGSRKGNNPAFSEAAHDLGKEMVKRKLDLVYGGGSAGLMGVLAETVHNGGCNVIGIIPRALMSREVGQTVGETRIVADMHERKNEMARLADTFIALPGGYGTLEELLEIITWAQLGIHHKTVGLLNVDGYYNNLLAMLDKGVQEGFIESTERIICVSADTVEELMDKMNFSYVVAVEEKTSKKRKTSI